MTDTSGGHPPTWCNSWWRGRRGRMAIVATVLVVVVPVLLSGITAASAELGTKSASAFAPGTFAEGVDDVVPAELPMVRDVGGTSPLYLRLYLTCWGSHQLPVDRTANTWGFNANASQLQYWNNQGVPMIVSLGYDPPVTTEPPIPSDEAVPEPDWPELYAQCATAFTERFSSLPELKAIDITNEPDIPNESTSDGAMPFVQLAVIDGVEAAHNALAAGNTTQIGFSWAYATGPYDMGLFSSWGALGGARFDADVDFVDMHIYPGTFAPEDPSFGVYPCGYVGPLTDPANLQRLASVTCLRRRRVPPASAQDPTSPFGYYYSSYSSVSYGIAYLRGVLMPMAGLGERTAIIIGETGYRSAGPGTSPDAQVPFFDPGNDYDQLEHLYGEWTAAWDMRSAPFNVRGFILYELADHYHLATGGSTSFGSCALPQPYSAVLTNCVTGFGLFAEPRADDYVARPFMCAYRSIIADPAAADADPQAGIEQFDQPCPVTYQVPG